MILRRLSDEKVKDLINNAREEDQYNEWKEIVTDKKLSNEIIAFLNNGTTRTCYLIIGITDIKTLVGIQNYRKELKRVEDLLHEHIKNSHYMFQKNILPLSYKYNKKDIIVISCNPLNKDTHAEDKNGKVYIRSASSCREINGDDLKEWLKDRKKSYTKTSISLKRLINKSSAFKKKSGNHLHGELVFNFNNKIDELLKNTTDEKIMKEYKDALNLLRENPKKYIDSELYRPFGDLVLEILENRQDTSFMDSYNKSSSSWEKLDRYETDPIYISLDFFDNMLADSLKHGTQHHCWMLYLYNITSSIEKNIQFQQKDFYGDNITRYIFFINYIFDILEYLILSIFTNPKLKNQENDKIIPVYAHTSILQESLLVIGKCFGVVVKSEKISPLYKQEKLKQIIMIFVKLNNSTGKYYLTNTGPLSAGAVTALTAATDKQWNICRIQIFLGQNFSWIQ